MTDFETDFSRAWKEFKETEEFIKAANPYSLPMTGPAEYLENRLFTAFTAGWNAKDKTKENADVVTSR
jgi:hypothetical protein